MTKKQHYVPRFLLKNFSDDQEAAWCLKKSNLKVFKTNIRNICCKSYLYETRWEDGFNESNALRWENIIQMGGGRFVRDILHEYLCR